MMEIMALNEEDLTILLELIRKDIAPGWGYHPEPKVARLQVKLSIMREAKHNVRLQREGV